MKLNTDHAQVVIDTLGERGQLADLLKAGIQQVAGQQRDEETHHLVCGER